MNNLVDTRKLKTGQYRLRFRLNENALKIVKHALSMTDYKSPNASLDAICMNYLASGILAGYQCRNMQGDNRLIVRLFPDQYELVREALNTANETFHSDTDSLVNICQGFLVGRKRNKQPA